MTTSGFRSLISTTLQRMKQEAHFIDLDGFIRFHNSYTAYTVWMFQTAIAGRVAKDLLLVPDDIDPELGVSSIRDKDSERPYHARLIWVLEGVRQQLAFYRSHRNQVVAELKLRGISCGDEPGFYLSSTMRHQPPSAKLMLESLSLPAKVPANAHRRYMRTELVERGCPVETVDAMLGHWALGEEPWASESTFDVSRHLETLRRYVPPLMSELGWQVVPSPLVFGYRRRWQCRPI